MAAWASEREGYLRGRLLLAGVRWEELNLRDRLDVTEAILIEPATNSGTGADEALDHLAKAIAETDPATIGTDPVSRRSAKAAQDMFKTGSTPRTGARPTPPQPAEPMAD